MVWVVSFFIAVISIVLFSYGWWFIAICVIGGGLPVIIKEVLDGERAGAARAQIERFTPYSAPCAVSGSVGKRQTPNPVDAFATGMGISMNPQIREVIVTRRDGGIARVGFKEIIDVEVCRDDLTVTKTSRGSQAAGAAVGFALLGPVGLLVGGLTGSKTTTAKISKASLRIYTINLTNPVVEVLFFDGPPISLSEVERQDWGKKLTLWYGRLRAVLSAN